MDNIIQRLKEAYHLETDAEVADFLGIKPSTLSMQKNRGRFNLERIIEKCSDLNKNWLLNGTGQMWEPEHSGGRKIPVFASISVADGGELDLQKSVKSGAIFTAVDSEANLPASDRLIGWAVSVDGGSQLLKEDDIAFVNLSQKDLRVGMSYLLAAEQDICCGRIIKENGSYVVGKYGSNNRIAYENVQILGAIVGMMRSFDT